MKRCNVRDKDTQRTCGEPGTVDGACYDHCVLCIVCSNEPAHPDTGICARCTSVEAVRSLKAKHDEAYQNKTIMLNAPIVQGQFTPKTAGGIGDLWEGVVTVFDEPMKIHAWLRDAVTLHQASVGDTVTCELVKGLKEVGGIQVEAGYRVVGGTLKINNKEE